MNQNSKHNTGDNPCLDEMFFNKFLHNCVSLSCSAVLLSLKSKRNNLNCFHCPFVNCWQSTNHILKNTNAHDAIDIALFIFDGKSNGTTNEANKTIYATLFMVLDIILQILFLRSFVKQST